MSISQLDLLDYDKKLLLELSGKPQEEIFWGAAMALSLSYLKREGLVKLLATNDGHEYVLTEEGKKMVKEIEDGK